MRITRTNADIDAIDGVLENVLRFISEQPSDWVIRVEHNGDCLGASSNGTIASFDQGILRLSELDEEDEPSGFTRTIRIDDITEIEVL